jgi:hypothetical protein
MQTRLVAELAVMTMAAPAQHIVASLTPGKGPSHLLQLALIWERPCQKKGWYLDVVKTFGH